MGVKKKLDIPMGVSQWRNHGVKYHYFEFFLNGWKSSIDYPVKGLGIKKNSEIVIAVRADLLKEFLQDEI